MVIYKYIYFALFILSSTAFASTQVGTITLVKGETLLLSDPSPKSSGPSPRVLYDNTYYTAKKAKVGMKLNSQNILQTLTDGQARVIFPNGDQINIGPSTAYSLQWTEIQKDNKSSDSLNLIYGKIRAVISQDGPRTGITIKTKTAVAGVRGTDFYVEYNPSELLTNVAVLRGEMEVKPASDLNKVLKVKSGQKAEIIKIENKTQGEQTTLLINEKSTSKIETLTKTELVEIEKVSTQKTSAETSEKLPEEITQLNQKAVENTLLEIKKYSPELYAKVSADPTQDVSKINTAAIADLYKQAPLGNKSKPSEKELNETNEDVYQKYFGH